MSFTTNRHMGTAAAEMAAFYLWDDLTCYHKSNENRFECEPGGMLVIETRTFNVRRSEIQDQCHGKTAACRWHT